MHVCPSSKCSDCPFFKKNSQQFLPTPPEYSKTNPCAVLIGESPGYEEKWRERPFIGPTGRAMWSALKTLNVSRQDFHILNRIACCPPRNKKTEKNMKKAAECCAEYFQANLKKCGNLPRLYMGKYAWAGELTKDQASLSREIIYKHSMVVDHPTYIFFHKPPMQIPWLAAMERFINYAKGRPRINKWSKLHIDVSTETVHLLNGLDNLVAWDTETYGIDFQDPDFRITCMGFSDGRTTITIPWDTYQTASHGTVWGLEYYGVLGTQIRQAVDNLFRSSRVFAAHNANYDLLAMKARGVEARNDFDTMIAYAILWSEIPKNLEDAAVHLVEVSNRWKTVHAIKVRNVKKEIKENRFHEVSPDEMREYNSHDAQASAWLAKKLYPMIVEDERLNALYENASKNLDVVRQMRQWGWQLDVDKQASLNSELQFRIDGVTSEARELLSDDLSEDELRVLNFNSTQQIQHILYGVLGAPVRYRTAQGAPSADKKSLEHIARSENGLAGQLANLLIKRKTAAKLKEAYIDNLQNKPEVRPDINIVGQVSGRWSVTTPALQTVPPPIKPIFIAHPGNWLVLADFSQLELRINAQLAKDEALLEAYEKGLDVHRLNAADLFNLPLEDAGGKWRNLAKTFAYRLSYCTMDEEGAAMGIFDTLSVKSKEITYKAVLSCVRRWWEQHPRLYERKKELLAKACKDWYVEEPFNHRRRYFYGPQKPKETEVFNFPMQAGGAAIVDAAIQAVHAKLDHTQEHLLLQRHDELAIEGPDPVRLAEVLWDNMTQNRSVDSIKMNYPIDLKVGLRWGQEVGISFDTQKNLFIIECSCSKTAKFAATAADLNQAVLLATEHVGTCERTAENSERLLLAKTALDKHPKL